MKKLIFNLLLTFIAAKVYSQTAFTFSGKVTGEPTAWVSLKYPNADGKIIRDSCSLKNETFNFKGDVNGGVQAFFSVYKNKREEGQNTVEIFIEPGNMTTDGTYGALNNLIISGSKSQLEYAAINARLSEMNKELNPISDRFNAVSREYKNAAKENKSNKLLDSLNGILTETRKQIEPFAVRYANIVHDFILKNPDSYISAFEMRVYASSWPIDSVKLIYNNFTPNVKNGFYGQIIRNSIKAIDENSANTPAKDFSTTDLNGRLLKLSDFKGKYVLLDFWGSWCVPCREGNPHLIELFKKYHNAGLEIIAVAANDTPNDWKRAIRNDHTEIWHNVLAGDKNSIGNEKPSITSKFSITVFPTKILVNKSGMIIGRYAGTGDTASLDAKLTGIFNGGN